MVNAEHMRARLEKNRKRNLDPRMDKLLARLNKPTTEKIEILRKVIRDTESKITLEGEAINATLTLEGTGKYPGFEDTAVCECDVNSNSSLGATANYMSGQYGGASFMTNDKEKDNVMDDNSRRQLDLKENKEAIANGRLTMPVVEYGCLIGGGPILNFGALFAFNERWAKSDYSPTNPGRSAVQFSRFERIDNVEGGPPFKYRGHDWLKIIKKPPLYLLPGSESKIKELELSLPGISFRLKDSPKQEMELEMEPSLGRFAEKFINGELSQEDLKIAVRCLMSIKNNEYIVVDGYARNAKTQLEQANLKMELIQFLLNVHGKMFTFSTNRTSGSSMQRIVFFDSEGKGTKYKKMVPTNPNEVSILEVGKEVEETAESKKVFDLIKQSLDSLKTDGKVNPVTFYEQLEQSIREIFLSHVDNQ